MEGIEPRLHGPFFGLLREARDKAGLPAIDDNPAELKKVVETTRDLVDQIQNEIGKVDFWQDANSQRHLETGLFTLLRRSRIVPRKLAEELATRLMDLARHCKAWLVS